MRREIVDLNVNKWFFFSANKTKRSSISSFSKRFFVVANFSFFENKNLYDTYYIYKYRYKKTLT